MESTTSNSTSSSAPAPAPTPWVPTPEWTAALEQGIQDMFDEEAAREEAELLDPELLYLFEEEEDPAIGETSGSIAQTAGVENEGEQREVCPPPTLTQEGCLEEMPRDNADEETSSSTAQTAEGEQGEVCPPPTTPSPDSALARQDSALPSSPDVLACESKPESDELVYLDDEQDAEYEAALLNWRDAKHRHAVLTNKLLKERWRGNLERAEEEVRRLARRFGIEADELGEGKESGGKRKREGEEGEGECKRVKV